MLSWRCKGQFQAVHAEEKVQEGNAHFSVHVPVINQTVGADESYPKFLHRVPSETVDRDRIREASVRAVVNVSCLLGQCRCCWSQTC